MKLIFEEYGSVILAVLVGVLLLSLIFGGIHLYKVLGNSVDFETTFVHSESEEAVKEVSERTVPDISVSDAKSLHLYVDRIFHPVASVSCKDHDGAIVPVSVTSILFIDEDGTKTEFIENYNKDTDEFDIPTVVTKTGTLAVTFRAVDSYNVTAIKTISYVIDAV